MLVAARSTADASASEKAVSVVPVSAILDTSHDDGIADRAPFCCMPSVGGRGGRSYARIGGANPADRLAGPRPLLVTICCSRESVTDITVYVGDSIWRGV